MTTRFQQGMLTVVLAVAGLLWCGPGHAQAHPQLIGRWFAAGAQGGLGAYDYAPGVYVGDNTWKGSYTFYLANCPIATGLYELRMINGTQGGLSMTDGAMIGWRVGLVDFGERVLTYMDVNYRK